jgi:hypothetical protein
MVDQLRFHACWSIYVGPCSRADLMEAHLPPISTALEDMEHDWDVSTEREAPGLFRLVMHQNFAVERVEDVIIPVLRRAYRLTKQWRTSGLDALASGKLEHVLGDCPITRPSRRPPSLESMIFEIKPGHIRRASRAEARAAGWPRGAWKIED